MEKISCGESAAGESCYVLPIVSLNGLDATGGAERLESRISAICLTLRKLQEVGKSLQEDLSGLTYIMIHMQRAVRYTANEGIRGCGGSSKGIGAGISKTE